MRLAHTGVAQLDSSAVEHLASALARPVLPGPQDNVQERAGDAFTRAVCGEPGRLRAGRELSGPAQEQGPLGGVAGKGGGLFELLPGLA